ncbi:hypothetical protein CROQUDRAFT_294379 [Cronartium quercuum f. sp. fusiforme G11]|uniref:Uncharacterized protein n=1 Tax=Cronartium quercuum f. sp. fusiforme G11 TaxID=708437 RepID=A0A9P6NCS9_9BASI|nr:hypothetical protein CROQUDRAFT_294379 [Cronartium quercuum f. sp. fusiforme G11]
MVESSRAFKMKGGEKGRFTGPTVGAVNKGFGDSYNSSKSAGVIVWLRCDSQQVVILTKLP